MSADKFKEECGIIGVFGHPEASTICYLGLHALQHRGQESAGIASTDGSKVHVYKAMGLVSDVFNEQILKDLQGNKAIGHVRYSTYGSSTIENAQPLLIRYIDGFFAVAHNGNLTNAHILRWNLIEQGAIFQTEMDTEVIPHLFARSKHASVEDRIIEVLTQIRGAYSLIMLTSNKLIAARDPWGFRPLVFGKLKRAYVIASETTAFDLIEAEYIREILPGEILIIGEDGINSLFPFKKLKKAQCIFEYIYFARPDSIVFGRNVYEVRKRLGMKLAEEHPASAEFTVPVPDSGVPAAIGYSEKSGIPFQIGLIRSHYVGRTFIEPSEHIRHFGVKIKLNPVREILKDKRIVLVDDSIVRGTTMRKIVKMLRDAGAREIHVRISSPPITHSCFFGIDTPTRQELIASHSTVDEINRFLTSDSLKYLSLEGLLSAVEDKEGEFCTGCFTGNYPVATPYDEDPSQMKLFERVIIERRKF